MSSDFTVYCINKVSSPPQALSRRKESGEFYCHIAVPVPEQLIIFTEGEWEEKKDFDVILRYKDDEIQLGHISKSNSCLSWKQSADMPASMLCESEKGLAKLVLENSPGPPLLINMAEGSIGSTVKQEKGDDIQLSDGSKPGKPVKNKRRTSLNKDIKSPETPVAKKQKLQTPKATTRVRKQDSQSKSTSTDEPDKTTIKKEKSTELKKSPEVKADDKKSSRRSNKNVTEIKDISEEKYNNSKKEPKGSIKGFFKDMSPKHDTSVNNENKVDTKEAKKDSTTEEKSDDKNDKKSRKSNTGRTESKERKSKAKNVENSENSGKDSPSVEKTQPKRRGRQSKKDTENVENTETDKCYKENVNSNLLSLSTDTEKTMSPLKTVNTVIPQNVPSEIIDISQLKGKIAVCKDLTVRALARPTGRWGHSLCFINKNLSILIGGQGEKQQLNKDSVWTLDTETRRWRSQATQSESQKPEYRMGHTATYDPMVRCIYVFGGSKNTRWFHDVHMLDIDEWKWQLVKVNGKAPTRAYHSATLYRHELWIFGGVYPRPDPQPDGCSNDIHIFSPVMESWYSPIVKGEKPLARSGHSATLLNDQLVVFGGWDAPISYSDIYILDMSIVEWTQPEFTGTPPSPRSWHASCGLTGNRLLIHGGYNGDFALDDTHIFNLDNMTWCKIGLDSQPTARVGHKAVCMPYRHDNEEEDEVIIFGGGDNDGAYFDDLMNIYVPFDPMILPAS